MYHHNQHHHQDNSLAITQSSSWNRSEDKLFEQALVRFPDDSPNRWLNIASQLPGKTDLDVRQHYEDLVQDVFEIDSGRVELPSYADDSGWESPSQISFVPKSKHGETERKKGTPWTEEEHKLFLIGLQKYGKGDWRSISRNVVVTRTATQVASHAQKYFLRRTSAKKERKRSSIHDITTVDNPPVAPLPVDQNWISSPGGNVPQQQVPVLQQFSPPSQFPDQGGSMGYQNYGFPM